MQTHLDERYLETQTKPDVFGKAKERPKHRRVNFKGDGAFRANDSGEDDNEEPAFRADDKKNQPWEDQMEKMPQLQTYSSPQINSILHF